MTERPGSSSLQRRWLAPVASLAGVALVVTGVVLVVNRGPAPAAGRQSPPAADPSPAADLLVRNGDEVVAKGMVVAAPGSPVMFCPPFAQVDIGTRQDKPPACVQDPRAIVVTGVDLDKLTRRETLQGVTFGYAELRGTWRDRTIAVTGQGPYGGSDSDEPPGIPTVDDDVPCPRPAGDWKRNKDLPAKVTAEVHGFVERQPDRFGALWVGYVDVAQERVGGPDWPDAKEILIVGVVEGDLEEARRDLDPLYSGNLCVTRTEQSITRRKQVTTELEALWTDHPEAVVTTAGQGPHNLPSVELVVLDQTTHDVLAGIGWDQFTVDAMIRPVR
jgi:hypothetical protein